MLNHLFATVLICMGVANTTPISNYDQKESNLVLTTPKKENIITPYTLNINYTNIQSDSWTSTYPAANTYYPQGNRRWSWRYNIQNNNNYISVKGNVYRQKPGVIVNTEDNQETTAWYIENYNIVNNNLDWANRERCELTYVYRFTPYNFNFETKATIRTGINIVEWENQNNIEWYTYEVYLIRNIYQSTQSQRDPMTNVITYPFDNYLDQTITQHNAYDICRDIEDINNGFYYTKKQDLIQIGYNTTTLTYQDEIEIDILPEQNNYYVIEYIPVVRPVEMGGGQSNEIMYLQIGDIMSPNQNYNTLTGTNVIPDGTYEVVDIPGIMFEVIGMPFAFVSQAFNLTLFPGTPYQVNIANLFLSIAAIFVFVWLLLLFIKMKG